MLVKNMPLLVEPVLDSNTFDHWIRMFIANRDEGQNFQCASSNCVFQLFMSLNVLRLECEAV